MHWRVKIGGCIFEKKLGGRIGEYPTAIYQAKNLLKTDNGIAHHTCFLLEI